MSAVIPWPRAFGGGPLLGERLVRVAYMDEAGIAPHEPHAIVSAVVLHADKQWRTAARRLEALADEAAPRGKRHGFAFHATELFSGGKTFPRESQGGPPARDRWRILERLVAVPAQENMPVVLGYARKKERISDRREQAISAHVWAYIMAVTALDQYMRDHTEPDDVVFIVAEDNQDARRHIKAAQALMQDKRAVAALLPPAMHGYLPLTRVVDTVHFAAKSEAPLLQLADACAFTHRRFYSGGADAESFMASFLGGDHEALRTCAPLDGPLGRRCFLWAHPQPRA